MLQHRDIAARLAKMEQRAIRFRARAEAALQHVDPDRYDGEMLNLFFTREEGDEIY
jgi:predicted 2-oxoglutarate/Fe(II)-dependent dioxygenase YbiX